MQCHLFTKVQYTCTYREQPHTISLHLYSSDLAFFVSALPMNPYGALGRSNPGMMSPISSGFGTSCEYKSHLARLCAFTNDNFIMYMQCADLYVVQALLY